MEETSYTIISFDDQNNALLSGAVITTNEFKDRTRLSGDENRRKIIIRSQTANTMDVDILDCPITDAEKECDGTPVNANLLGEFRNVIIQSDTNASRAYNIAKISYENSKFACDEAVRINGDLTTVRGIAQEAKDASAATQTSLEELSNQVIEQQGTKVSVGGVFVSTFDADTKASVESLNNVSSRVSTLETKPILTNVVYDAATDTFTF